MKGKQRFLPMMLMMGLVALVLALLTAVTSNAQSIATITTDQQEITVGDPVVLTVSVTHPEDSIVLFPELEPHWGDLVVRNQSPALTTSNSDGTAVTSQQIDVRLFAPGAFQTPPLTVTISDNAGNLTETVADPLPLAVQSVLIEGDTDLRDIKPQAQLPTPAIWPYVLVSLFAGVAAIAFIIWKRRGGRLFVDNRLPHEKALATLTHIDKQNYPANGRYKEQYAAVSDTLRRYFEAIGDVPMTDRTTAEIRHDLAASQMKQADADRLLMILEDSDWVKFAKVQPSQHEAERLTQNARQLVLDTKPQPVTEDTSKKNRNKPKGQKPLKHAVSGD